MTQTVDLLQHPNLPAVALTSADFTVSDATRVRIERAVPESTRRAYAGDLARFRDWCADRGRSALPATAETMADYATCLAEQGKAPSTITRALAAIRTAHRNAAAKVPDTTGAGYVLRSHRRDQAAAGRRERKAAPVTIDVLRALVEATDPATLAGLRNRALVVLGFALGARRSELVGLDLADVREAPEGLVVLIRQSKTDQDAVGVEVALPYGAHPETCPVRTVRGWREALQAAGVDSGPLFRRIDRHGALCGAGRGSDDRLSGQAVGLVLRRLAAHAEPGSVPALTAHSLRAGFATVAYQAGADTLSIARHGRWKDGSPVLLGYVRSVDRWRSNPLAGVGL